MAKPVNPRAADCSHDWCAVAESSRTLHWVRTLGPPEDAWHSDELRKLGSHLRALPRSDALNVCVARFVFENRTGQFVFPVKAMSVCRDIDLKSFPMSGDYDGYTLVADEKVKPGPSPFKRKNPAAERDVEFAQGLLRIVDAPSLTFPLRGALGKACEECTRTTLRHSEQQMLLHPRSPVKETLRDALGKHGSEWETVTLDVVSYPLDMCGHCGLLMLPVLKYLLAICGLHVTTAAVRTSGVTEAGGKVDLGGVTLRLASRSSQLAELAAELSAPVLMSKSMVPQWTPPAGPITPSAVSASDALHPGHADETPLDAKEDRAELSGAGGGAASSHA